MTSNPIFVAIDTPDMAMARQLITTLAPYAGGIKLGLEFYVANGAPGVATVMAGVDLPLFLDLKLHDIPNTVAGAVRSVCTAVAPTFLTIHTSGGPAMLTAAVDAAKETGAETKLLGVTVLTSLDDGDLTQVGQTPPVADQVMRLTRVAREAGLDGVICAPSEIVPLRSTVGSDFILMVPGIRPTGSATGDQKRTMTPDAAVAAGASFLVIGRPITAAPDPAEVARRLAAMW